MITEIIISILAFLAGWFTRDGIREVKREQIEGNKEWGGK